MGTSVVSGINWSVDGDVFRFFGHMGLRSGRNWIVGHIEIDPCPVSKDILDILKDDALAGNAEKVAYVGVDPFHALYLALEGMITVENLVASVETPGRIELEFLLCGTPQKLVIIGDAEYAMATYDSNDQIV